MPFIRVISLLFLLVLPGFSLHGLAIGRGASHDSQHKVRSIAEQIPHPLYTDGSDGADVKAMLSAWSMFATTAGLAGSELDMENYWLKIRATKVHRVVEIYPKPRAETRDVPIEDLPTDEWNWGTEGTFWVNTATLEVDRKFVLPPRPDRG